MKKGKSLVRFIFKEKMWPEMQSFKARFFCELHLQTASVQCTNVKLFFSVWVHVGTQSAAAITA